MSTLPADLPYRLRKAGLRVAEIPGWRTRGRPGSFEPVGVLWHHTGGAADGESYARWMALVGRPDLPAPLCQLAIGRDGTVYIIAAGRANHAGKAKASGPVGAGDGNTLYVGVECMNTGSEGWSGPQYEAMVKAGLVLSKVLGCTEAYHRGHRETSVTGKWDPGLLDLDDFRADLRDGLARPAAVQTIRKEITRGIQRFKKAQQAAKDAGLPNIAQTLGKQVDRARKIRNRPSLRK